MLVHIHVRHITSTRNLSRTQMLCTHTLLVLTALCFCRSAQRQVWPATATVWCHCAGGYMHVCQCSIAQLLVPDGTANHNRWAKHRTWLPWVYCCIVHIEPVCAALRMANRSWCIAGIMPSHQDDLTHHRGLLRNVDTYVHAVPAGIGAAGQSQCIMLISTETAGPSFRGIASVMSLAFITLGEFLLVALAYGVPNWRYLTLAAAGLNAVGLLLFPFVSESARWGVGHMAS